MASIWTSGTSFVKNAEIKVLVLEDYTNINFEGAPSTASEDEDDRDSVYNFRN